MRRKSPLTTPLTRQQATVRSWAIALTLFGVAATAAVGWVSWRAWQVEHRWPTVEGEMLERDVESKESWKPLGRRFDKQRALVFYAYFVDGVEYEGRAIAPFWLPGAQLPLHQQRLVEDLPARGTVRVRYDPSDPGHSYLHGGLDPTLAASWGGVTGVFLLAGLVLWPLAKLPPRPRRRAISWWFSLSFLAFAVALGALGAHSLALGGTFGTLATAVLIAIAALASILRPVLFPRSAGAPAPSR